MKNSVFFLKNWLSEKCAEFKDFFLLFKGLVFFRFLWPQRKGTYLDVMRCFAGATNYHVSGAHALQVIEVAPRCRLGRLVKEYGQILIDPDKGPCDAHT